MILVWSLWSVMILWIEFFQLKSNQTWALPYFVTKKTTKLVECSTRLITYADNECKSERWKYLQNSSMKFVKRWWSLHS
jgi:hypothetical protein